ncbi:MAG TPA: galactokinase [Gemmatimonadaceae bacterium]|nr:galactokinase [Gemmatimonadaceae bacterium]
MTTDELRAAFAAQFNAEPALIASAPGRVNVIGEHTDYNGGEVLPIAIDRRTFVAMSARENAYSSRVFSTSDSASGEFDASSPVRAGAWWDYMAGVCASITQDGVTPPQFNALVASDVPIGAGLSSSAALEVATGLALTALTKHSLAKKDLALAGWRAENQFVGVNSGVMDQFASSLCESRRALHVWCDTLDTQAVPMQECVLIFDTATTRSLRGSEFNTRRAECDEALRLIKTRFPEIQNLADASVTEVEEAQLPEVLNLRALHVVKENARVGTVVQALQSTGRVPGEVLFTSHESLRVQYECSTPQLDWFVDRMKGCKGVSGARLTGAGWGGCAIAVGSPDALGAVRDETATAYEKKFGLKPRIWLTFAGEGARIEPA